MVKTKRILLPVSEKEKESLSAAAEKLGLSVSAFLRLSALEKIKKMEGVK